MTIALRVLTIGCISLAFVVHAAGANDAVPLQASIAIAPDSPHYRTAQRAAGLVSVVNSKIKTRYPGLARYAHQRDYRIVIADLPDGISGRHTGARRLIQLDYSLGMDADRLAFVYAHEIGHAIWDGLPRPDRQAVIDEYAAEVRAGRQPAADVAEVFADLTGRVATGRLVDVLPAAQRLIRARICK